MKAYVARHQVALADAIRDDDPLSGGEELGRRNAKVADGLLSSVQAIAMACTGSELAGRVALAAVGSYGRGAVALRSDLDVRFLVEDGPEEAAAPLAEAMLYPLWDGGLQVGHQIVSLPHALELARTDLPTATSILDWRHLGGEARLSRELLAQARALLFGDAGIGAFVRRLDEEIEARHPRFGGSVYLLEPDVRNGPGGLRDVDVAGWAANARWGATDLPALVRLGVVVAREATRMAEARSLLWRIRNRLHRAAGRRADRLTFDMQERLAVELGYGEGGAAVESFMSDYYRSARAVSQVREIIFHRARPFVSRKKPHEEDIGAGLRLFDGQVTFANPDELARDPSLAFRLFAEAIAREKPIFPFARDAVARAAQDAAFVEALRRSPEAARLFVELATTAKETIFSRRSVLGELHDVGLLVAMIPEFSPVIGRVHHDVYHVYTVDVHSVAAVDRLRALARGDLAAEFPLACRLAAEISRPVVLYLATLLHDVGKAIGGKDHAVRGADMVMLIGERLGLPQADTEEIAHLVRTHLVMYHQATRRDLDDPSTIEDFLRDIRGQENLRELFLLTVADLSTTSPTALTSWKAKLLDELYLATDRALLGAHGDVADAGLSTVRADVCGRVGDTPFARSFVSTMPARYLLSNTPEAIAAHLGLAARRAAAEPAVELRPLAHDMSELCVVAPDRPGLLASIAAAIVACRLEVHAAQIHSHAREDGTTEAVDLFWVRGPGAEPMQVPHTQRTMERELSAMLRGEKTPRAILSTRGKPQWTSRSTPMVETQVSIDDRGSQRHGIIEVITRDRPGVLYALANALHELRLSISLAKINTEGTRVADVFYVTDEAGRKAALLPRIDAIREGILGALQDEA